MNTIDNINTKYLYIIHTPMTLNTKKELLLQLILQLDDTKDVKELRKNYIIQIQNTLTILDNVLF